MAARRFLGIGLLAILICFTALRPAGAQTVKIGLQKIAPLGPVFVAVDKGYFAAEGLTPELVFFDASQPIAVAAASGDIDFGVTGLTAGFYNLAGKGVLRIIASQVEEAQGFKGGVLVASNRAYADGLVSVKDLKGHSVAVTQIGSAIHYSLGLVVAKYGMDIADVRVLPLQTNANSVSAVIGGQADAALTPANNVLPSIARGEAKLLAYVGDEVHWQLGAVFTATRTADEREDLVRRFLIAYRKGTRSYHDAFAGPDDIRRDGPDAPEIVAIIAKYTGDTETNVRGGISYVDAEGRLDAADITRQVEWYKSRRMVSADVDGTALVDRRYAETLPGR
jgi:NitT/TauT family transport system substrate-binding protein